MPSLRTVLLAASVLLLQSCGRSAWRPMSEWSLAQSDLDTKAAEQSPWAGIDDRVTTEAQVCGFVTATWKNYRWVSSTGQKFDPESICQKIDSFLRLRDAITVTLPASHRGDPHWQQTSVEDRDQIPLVITSRIYLVCVDPIVCLMTDGESPYRKAWVYQGLDHELDLPKGITARTNVPVLGETRWFSPTLKIPPTPLTMPPGETSTIAVPWGRLTLENRSGTVEVRATR